MSASRSAGRGEHVAEQLDAERRRAGRQPRVVRGVLLGGEGVHVAADRGRPASAMSRATRVSRALEQQVLEEVRHAGSARRARHARRRRPTRPTHDRAGLGHSLGDDTEPDASVVISMREPLSDGGGDPPPPLRPRPAAAVATAAAALSRRPTAAAAAAGPRSPNSSRASASNASSNDTKRRARSTTSSRRRTEVPGWRRRRRCPRRAVALVALADRA